MASTAQSMREWSGPAILSYGFRPFFLFGALWAGCAMLLWVLMLGGRIALPTRFDPVEWHSHAFLVGYLGAIVSGFLLTAVPNWTGRLPVVGWRLGLLIGLWICGRVAVTLSLWLPLWVVALLDLSSLVVLALMLLREIVAGRNWRNLIVLVMLGVLIIGAALFHVGLARPDLLPEGIAVRVTLAAGIMMISVIGGRVVPSFTRNWLVKAGSDVRPASPMRRFDKVTLLVSVIALAIWVAVPDRFETAIAVLIMGVMQAARLVRWRGAATLSEPLVWVLHLAYGCVPAGALVMGLAMMAQDTGAVAGAQHVWMAGAIGLMTLAVMTRATLGHTGQVLTAGRGTLLVYLSLVGAVLIRVGAGWLPDMASQLYALSALLWCTAFFGFAAVYGPLLLRAQKS